MKTFRAKVLGFFVGNFNALKERARLFSAAKKTAPVSVLFARNIGQILSKFVMKYNRSIEELNSKAVIWWPDHLADLERGSSIVPALIKSQDKFLSILNISDADPFSIFDVIRTSKFAANLFLKHLVVLADVGGEPIQRINSQFSRVFSKRGERHCFEFSWHGKDYEYCFKELPISGAGNKKFGIDGPSLSTPTELTPMVEDLMVLLMFGALAKDEEIATTLFKCEIGGLLGHKEELENYVKQKYLLVSRITGGAQSNTLGQVAQTYATKYLREKLGDAYKVTRNGHIAVAGGVSIPMDILVEKDKKSVGIEITFQVTTNSVIERKAGQAKARQDIIHKDGNYIAYIIDGAGNFHRRSAVSTICKFSDCTVAYSDEEFDVLCDFIREKL